MFVPIKRFIFSGFILLLGYTSCSPREDMLQPEEKPVPYNLVIPKGFPAMDIPLDNPLTVEGVQLGRKLFYDNILSADRSLSCAGCHNQAAGFSDPGIRVSKGVANAEGLRNAQALVNLGFNRRFFWDGRARSLEEQALEPVTNPREMASDWKTVLGRLKAHPEYSREFKKVFGTTNVDSTHVAKAIAQFMRTMISYNSRFDRRARNEISLSPSELNGFVIFNTEKGDCFHCHNADAGRLFTDNQFHNNGIDDVFPDPGLAAITGRTDDLGKFLTPSLRNVALTAPYMHDGRFSTLEEVIEHYNSGGKASATVDPLMKNVGKGLNLSKQEKQDLLAFLHALTDSTYITDKRFSKP